MLRQKRLEEGPRKNTCWVQEDARKSEYVATGKEAAELTIELMRNTFNLLPPAKMVQTYLDVGKAGKALRMRFGQSTGENDPGNAGRYLYARRTLGERMGCCRRGVGPQGLLHPWRKPRLPRCRPQ